MGGSPGELGRTGVRWAARGKQRWPYGQRVSLEKMEDFNLGEGEEGKITMGRINCKMNITKPNLGESPLGKRESVKGEEE